MSHPLRADGPSVGVCIRLSPEERSRVDAAARCVGLYASEFVRVAILHRATASDVSFKDYLAGYLTTRVRPRGSTAAGRRNAAVRHALLLAAFVEPVDRNLVYDRHAGVCGICGRLVPRADFAIDHIVPLSKGGLHSYANTQPSHSLCNSRKGARIGFRVTP